MTGIVFLSCWFSNYLRRQYVVRKQQLPETLPLNSLVPHFHTEQDTVLSDLLRSLQVLFEGNATDYLII